MNEMNRGRSKISGLAIAKLRRTWLFWHAFLIPLINTYLRLFSEYEQQTLYKRTSVKSPNYAHDGRTASSSAFDIGLV